MAVRTVELYDPETDTTFGEIYFNTNNRQWYSDSDCTSQISHVEIPTRSQYAFTGYRISNASTATLYVDESGAIVYTPTWTSSGTTMLYARWKQISRRFVIDWTTKSFTPVFPLSEWFRSVAASTRFYADSQLTQEIDGIGVPLAEGLKFNGVYTTDESGNVMNNYVGTDGKFITPSLWTSSDSTYEFKLSDSIIRFLTCYYMNLNANGGIGGEAKKVYYDRVNGKWCNDEYMVNVITAVALPTLSGKIFKGYYTDSSGGTQVIDAHGGFLSGAELTSANKTFYAQWVSPFEITLNLGGGTGGTSALWYGGGKFYDSSSLDNEVTAIVSPTKTNHRFLGYFYGGEKVIDEAGNILATTASANLTVTAQWERVSYTVNISLYGGTGPAAIYADVAKTGYFATDQCDGQPLASVSIFKAGSKFDGVFSIDGDKIVEDDGTFTAYAQTFLAALSADATLYAHFRTVATITLDAQGGTTPAPVLYFDANAELFYDAPQMTTPVTTIGRPRKECNGFVRYSTEDGAQVVDAAGNISATWKPTEDATIAATWERVSWKLAINPDGGSGGSTAVYRNGGSTWYADDQCTTPTTKIVPPTRPGYTFAGAYENDDPNTLVVRADGTITASPSLQSDNLTVTALWTANTYTLTFDYNGGTGTTQQKTVTFGQPIGELPAATRNRAVFTGWRIDGESVEATTSYNVPGNGLAVAAWSLQFGKVTDYFGLASSSLIPIASNNGDNKKRLCVAHIGKYEPNVDAVSGIWRNPTVTYVVARDITLNVVLGRAYKGINTTGYMIVAARIATGVGNFPTVTIQAVANEGADAINKFNVSVPIVARSKAQNLLGAVSGGGHLNVCELTATCDPVVVEENMMPCASDVVNGRYELEATTIATNREIAPTAAVGFASIGEPKEETESTYTTYKLTAQKEIR